MEHAIKTLRDSNHVYTVLIKSILDEVEKVEAGKPLDSFRTAGLLIALDKVVGQDDVELEALHESIMAAQPACNILSPVRVGIFDRLKRLLGKHQWQA
jgi:hypothetical protein